MPISNREEKASILAYSPRGDTDYCVRKAWEQKGGASLAVRKQTDHISSIHKKQNRRFLPRTQHAPL